MHIIVQVFNQGFGFLMIKIQIPLNVMATMVVVVSYVTTLKEAMCVYVTVAMY